MQRHSTAARRQGRPGVARLLITQGALTLLLTGGAAALAGHQAALAALLGGMTSLIPSLYFVWRLGTLRGGRQARRFVATFYRAEAGKFGLTVALFALVFVAVPPSNPIFFFVAYVAVLFTHWLTPWLARGSPAP